MFSSEDCTLVPLFSNFLFKVLISELLPFSETLEATDSGEELVSDKREELFPADGENFVFLEDELEEDELEEEELEEDELEEEELEEDESEFESELASEFESEPEPDWIVNFFVISPTLISKSPAGTAFVL
jgi:hypothetical protein